MTRLVSDYKSYEIPVGALNIDSEWATAFNNFEVDTAKFPDFQGMVSDFHAQDVRVILWATSMVGISINSNTECTLVGCISAIYILFSSSLMHSLLPCKYYLLGEHG